MPFDLSRYWYQKTLHPVLALFLPFSWLFQFITNLRYQLYRQGVLATHHFNVPIIVVGNITVGGTGKTPFVIELAKFLRDQGFHPGIVSRGVGGQKHKKPHRVEETDCAQKVGDEALLLVRHTQCPLVIGVDRVSAVKELLKTTSCNVIISDDGLQHYRLGRTVEIAMMDGWRELGNQYLLPAGPLRENPSRLLHVDMTIVNGERNEHQLLKTNMNSFRMTIEPKQIIAIHHPEKSFSLENFPYKKIHLVAGIGHPERFFALFRQAGFEIIPHIFSDHYLYKPHDFDFKDDYPIVMTEKDAVKVGAFADQRYWFLRITAKIDDEAMEKILTKIKNITDVKKGWFSKNH